MPCGDSRRVRRGKRHWVKETKHRSARLRCCPETASGGPGLARALTPMRGTRGSSWAEAPRNHDARYLGLGGICSCSAAGSVVCVYPTVQEDWRPADELLAPGGAYA